MTATENNGHRCPQGIAHYLRPRDPRTQNAILAILLAAGFVVLFRVSLDWPVIGGTAHLFVFWLPMAALIFLTTYRALRKFNAYVAENITDHSLLKRIAEKRAASFLAALMLGLTLSASMAVFVYTARWSEMYIVLAGFILVAWLIRTFSFDRYLRKGVAEISKGYVAVGVASSFMVVAHVALLILSPGLSFEPISHELIEYVRDNVSHPNYLFESLARTVVFVNGSILTLGNVEGFARGVVVALIVVTTSSVPFVALSLFMRSLYEWVGRGFLAAHAQNPESGRARLQGFGSPGDDR